MIMQSIRQYDQQAFDHAQMMFYISCGAVALSTVLLAVVVVQKMRQNKDRS